MTPQRAALGLLAVLLACGTAWAKSYDHPLIEQTFQLLSDGDALVDDLRTFRFEGSFSWAELRLRTTGRYGRYGVDYLGVWDADTGQPLRIERSGDGGERVLRWYYQAQDTTRRFLLRYRISGAVQRYGDVAQFYWKAIEDDHAPLRQVRVTIVPPHPSPSLFKVFVHSRAGPGTLQFAADYSRAAITQSGIPTTSFVEVRAFLDPARFPEAPVRTGQTLESLLADERQQSAPGLRIDRLVSLGFLVSGALMLGLILGFMWTYVRYGKEWHVLYDAPYEHDAPRALPPAVVPAILTQTRAQPSEMPKAFSATLLEAARLGYLQIEETQDQGVLGSGLFKDTDLIFRLTDKGRALLSGKAPELKPGERALEPFEATVLQTVFRNAGQADAVTSDQIESWGKKIVGSKSNFLCFVETWGPQLRRWFEQTFFKLDDPASERARIVFIAVTIATLIVMFFADFGVSMIVGGPVGVVLIMLAWKTLARRTPDAALEVKRWDAFRRFMTDFSAMEDAGPNLLPLWERYLVYATALGVAEHLLRNLKLVAEKLGQTVPSASWYRTSGMPGGGTGMSIGPLESMTRSFQNFQNLSRALSSSTSTGGGFRGAGGGGGGGGSSRAG